MDLIDHKHTMSDSLDKQHRREVIVKIDEGDSAADPAGKARIWREFSIDSFWTEENANAARAAGAGGSGGFQFQQGGGRGGKKAAVEEEEDPPSRLIGQFLHKQKALEMDELIRNRSRPLITNLNNIAPDLLSNQPLSLLLY